jgi:hypothetical protein
MKQIKNIIVTRLMDDLYLKEEIKEKLNMV